MPLLKPSRQVGTREPRARCWSGSITSYGSVRLRLGCAFVPLQTSPWPHAAPHAQARATASQKPCPCHTSAPDSFDVRSSTSPLQRVHSLSRYAFHCRVVNMGAESGGLIVGRPTSPQYKQPAGRAPSPAPGPCRFQSPSADCPAQTPPGLLPAQLPRPRPGPAPSWPGSKPAAPRPARPKGGKHASCLWGFRSSGLACRLGRVWC